MDVGPPPPKQTKAKAASKDDDDGMPELIDDVSDDMDDMPELADASAGKSGGESAAWLACLYERTHTPASGTYSRILAYHAQLFK